MNYNLQNQSNTSIQKSEINISGKFDNRNYNNILVNNKTEITLYEKPKSLEGNPNLFQQTKSLIPHDDDLFNYIKQIQFVEQNTSLSNKAPLTLYYNKQHWYEVKITFSNNDVQNYLLPVSTKITMVDEILRIYCTVEIPRLIQDGLIIKKLDKEIKSSKKVKKKDYFNLNNI